MNGDPIKDLYDSFKGDKSVNLEDLGTFRKMMENQDFRKDFYGHLSENYKDDPNVSIGSNYEEFEQVFGQKKKDQTVLGSPESAGDGQSTSSTNQNLLPDPMVAPSSSTNVQQPLIVTDPTDIQQTFDNVVKTQSAVTYGEDKRMATAPSIGDYASNMAAVAQYDVAIAKRKLQNIEQYKSDSDAVEKELTSCIQKKYGENAIEEYSEKAQKLAEIKEKIDQEPDDLKKNGLIAQANALLDQINGFRKDEDFKMLSQVSERQEASFDEYKQVFKDHPEFNRLTEDIKASQAEADQYGKDSPIKSAVSQTKNTLGRGASRLVGGLLSMPRSVLNSTGAGNTEADQLGVFADRLVDESLNFFPKRSDLDRGLREKVVEFEGNEVVIKDDKVQSVRDENGYLVRDLDDDYIKRFNESGKIKEATDKFTGGDVLLSKVGDTAVDLAILIGLTKGIGGGVRAAGYSNLATSNLPVVLGTVIQMNQEAYRESIKSGATPEQAGRFSMISGLKAGAINMLMPMERNLAFGRYKKSLSAVDLSKGLGLQGGVSKANQVAKSFGRVALSGLGESVEEVADQLADTGLKAVYNLNTDTDFKTSVEKNELIETAIVSAIVGSGFGMAGLPGKSQLYDNAMYLAVDKPAVFDKSLEMLQEAGVDKDRIEQIKNRVEKLRSQVGNIDGNLTEEQKVQIVKLQDQRAELEEKSSQANVELVKQQIKESINKIDEQVSGIIGSNSNIEKEQKTAVSDGSSSPKGSNETADNTTVDEVKESVPQAEQGQGQDTESTGIKEPDTATPTTTRPTSTDSQDQQNTQVSKKTDDNKAYKYGDLEVRSTDGQIDVINTKSGKPASAGARKRAIKKYRTEVLDDIARQGDRADVAKVEDPAQLDQKVLAESTSPAQVAASWQVQDDKLDSEQTKDDIIAEGLGHVTRDALRKFVEIDRPDYAKLRQIYVRNKSGNKALDTDLSELAEQMSEASGMNITDQDIADHILENQESRYRSDNVNEVKQQLAEKFKSLTGLDIDNQFAAQLVQRENILRQADEQSRIGDIYTSGQVQSNESPAQREVGTTMIKSLEARAIEDPSLTEEQRQAVKDNGLNYETVSQKEVNAIADKYFDDKMEMYAGTVGLEDMIDQISRTTRQEYEDNDILSTLHTMLLTKIADHYRKQGQMGKFVAAVDKLSKGLRSSGRGISAARASATPESFANHFVIKLFEQQKDMLSKTGVRGKSYMELLENLTNELKVTKEELSNAKARISYFKNNQGSGRKTKANKTSITAQKKDLKKERKAIINDLKSKWNNLSNSGASFDPKQEADRIFEFHKSVGDLLKNYINEGLLTVKQAVAKVKKELKEIGLNNDQIKAATDAAIKTPGLNVDKRDLAEIIIDDHYQNPGLKPIAQKLQEELGMSKSEAQKIEKELTLELSKERGEKSRKAIEEFTGEVTEPKKRPKARKHVEKVIDAANAGLLNQEETRNKMAGFFGYTPIDQETVDRLMNIINIINETPSRSQKAKYNRELQFELSKFKPMSHASIAKEIYTAIVMNAISGIMTSFNANFGAFATYAPFSLVEIIRSPIGALYGAKQALGGRGVKVGLKSFWDILKTNHSEYDDLGTIFDGKTIEGSSKLERIALKGWGDNNKVAYAFLQAWRMVYALKAVDSVVTNGMGEFLSGIDAYNKVIAKERQQTGKRVGLTGRFGGRIASKVDAMLKNDPVSVDSAQIQARQELEDMAERGEKPVRNYVIRRTKEIILEQREEDNVRWGYEGAKDMIGMAPATGIPGFLFSKFSKTVTNFRDTDHPINIYTKLTAAVFFGLFGRITSWSMMQLINNLPLLGMANAFAEFSRDQDGRWEFRKRDVRKRNQILARNIAFTTMGVDAFQSMFEMEDDEEDGWVVKLKEDRLIDVVASGKGSFFDNIEAYKGKSYFIRYRNSPDEAFSEPLEYKFFLPLAPALAMLGGLSDDLKKDPKMWSDKGKLEVAQDVAVNDVFSIMFALTFSQSIQFPVDVINKAQREGASGATSEVFEKVGKTATTVIQPNLYRDVYNEFKIGLGIGQKKTDGLLSEVATKFVLTEAFYTDLKTDVFGNTIYPKSKLWFIPNVEATKWMKKNAETFKKPEWKLVLKYENVQSKGKYTPPKKLARFGRLSEEQRESVQDEHSKIFGNLVRESYKELDKMDSASLQAALDNLHKTAKDRALITVLSRSKK